MFMVLIHYEAVMMRKLAKCFQKYAVSPPQTQTLGRVPPRTHTQNSRHSDVPNTRGRVAA